jgi:hypothetical protein
MLKNLVKLCPNINQLFDIFYVFSTMSIDGLMIEQNLIFQLCISTESTVWTIISYHLKIYRKKF